MFKSILVPTTGFSGDPAALETALAVARIFGGHLDCLHVHPDPRQIFLQAASYDVGMGAGVSFAVADVAKVLEDEDRKYTERSKAVFDALRQREKLELAATPPSAHHPSAAWHEVTGRELDILAMQARVHDLTVIGHPTYWGGLARDVVGALLVRSGRPVLLAPVKAPARIGHTIAIAWKDTPEAAHALTAAMPLIERAERIVLINIAEHEEVTIEPVEALATSLRWHDIKTEVRYLAHPCGSIHDTILTLSKEVGADLLVMGGYGHSRTAEFIFGGFTRHVLAGVSLPILVAH